MTEPPEFNGLSHLYEHMFFKGNRALPNQEAFLEKTRELGMVFNGSTETEQVNYYFTTTSDKLIPSLSLMRDSIESPLFDPEELRREQQVVIGEIDRDDADPFYHFGHEMDLALSLIHIFAGRPKNIRELQAAIEQDVGDVVPGHIDLEGGIRDGPAFALSLIHI